MLLILLVMCRPIAINQSVLFVVIVSLLRYVYNFNFLKKKKTIVIRESKYLENESNLKIQYEKTQ